MKENNKRRSFLKNITLGGLGAAVAPTAFARAEEESSSHVPVDEEGVQYNKADTGTKRSYNAPYTGEYLNRVAFPIGGLGAGMFCLEGTGAISHMSVRHKPEIFNEPAMFAAIYIKGIKNGAKVIEGQVPQWKFFGQRGTGNGAAGTTFGLPRFKHAEFTTAFPYAQVKLTDSDIPLQVAINGWSPFVPTDEDSSGLPVGALEYTFTNKGTTAVQGVFSYNSKNFLVSPGGGRNSTEKTRNGFVLTQDGTKESPEKQGHFAIFTDDDTTVVDYSWFRGGWWDPITMAWNKIKEGNITPVDMVDANAPGASLYVPFTVAAGSK